MSALEKGLKVSPTGSVAGSFCIRKKMSSPRGPYVPGTFHSMDAVRKHTLSIGSKSPPLRETLPPSTRAETSFLRFFHTPQGFIQRNNWIFEVLFPKCSSCLVSSSDVVFTRGIVVFFFSCILGFCFLGFLWLLNTALLIFL